ncbi:MAG: ribonuclease R [Gudongella sp.]|jgi:ribonuclease R|nr:ribonuclease R [Gudongella sp.]
MSLKDAITDLMEHQGYKPLMREELAVKLGINRKEFKDFFKVINDMEKEGLILRTKNDRYTLLNSEYLTVGVVEGNEKGFGFVVSKERPGEDVFIPPENMNGAMHKDKVIVNLLSGKIPGRKQNGEIIRVLERANKSVIGTFESNGGYGFVIPDNKKISYDFYVSKTNSMNAKNGQKVVVEITKWPEIRRNPEGKITEVIGYPWEKGTDILSIVRQFELPSEFSVKVRQEAEAVSKDISKDEIGKRRDLRDLNTVTIDGADARDFDDAVSIQRLENGDYRLGVHIADVAHYVKEGSALDREALNRGNSVYLLDRVIPMLPQELSNGICSLNPHEDRLTLSVIMDIDDKGKVVSHEIIESVIKSKARLVYDDVSDFLEGKGEANDTIVSLENDLVLMKELMNILWDRRERRGSIDFDFPESYIELDKSGRPIDVRRADRRIANRLIEEFMLVCNETVSETYFWAQIPFLYRIHEDPSPEKVIEFQKFIHNFGYSIKGKELFPKDFQGLIEEIKGKKEEPVISTLLLRTMKKAVYSAEPGKHFGLAAQYYSHFTSPIRRYPDLEIHRIIKYTLKGVIKPSKLEQLEGWLPEVAEHTSMTERRAEDAEREVEDLKKAQYMAERIGQHYSGIISSLTSFGMFVQLENTIEGLIHFNNMEDDYYFFDEISYKVIGERTKRVYKLGDEIEIIVIGADIGKKTIDFSIKGSNVDKYR